MKRISGSHYFISSQIRLTALPIREMQVFFFFFCLGFLSRTFTSYRTAGEGRGHSINSSLPLPSASQTLTHQPGDYCRELTSAHSQQPDSNREPLASEHKSLTTKLRALCQVLRHVNVARIYISITKDLKFDWSIHD